MSWLVFPNPQAAQQREEEISAALGYPDPTGIYTRYATPIEHPTSGEGAIVITTVCSTASEPYEVVDAQNFLTPEEVSSLKTDEEMHDAGWWGEES